MWSSSTVPGMAGSWWRGVEGLTPEARWSMAYDEINEFERELSRWGGRSAEILAPDRPGYPAPPV